MGECSFWYRPTRVVPDQRPLNGRCCQHWFCTDNRQNASKVPSLISPVVIYKGRGQQVIFCGCGQCFYLLQCSDSVGCVMKGLQPQKHVPLMNTHTHNHLMALLCPGLPRGVDPEETFTHSHPITHPDHQTAFINLLHLM